MISFNEPVFSENVIVNIRDAFARKKTSGDGHYTKLCNNKLSEIFNVKHSLVVHSGTAALEMAAIISGVQSGDEVIMPSYTFCSTANAFVLRGAIPVFVDIRPDTLNIDENLIERAITKNTKAIVVVHYAGVACEMDKILSIARKYNLFLIEDVAQGFDSYYRGKHLGTIGDIGCFSFHETKNVMSGEGGAFVTNNNEFYKQAEIIREKGTNRSQFFRGQVDKYTWVEQGSSFLPSDIISAYLYANLEMYKKIQEKRINIWNQYNSGLKDLADRKLVRLPVIPAECSNNAHMYYMLCRNLDERTSFIDYMKANSISTPFHYVPLHTSPAGQRYCKVSSTMDVTKNVSETLVRLPLFYDLSSDSVKYIVNCIHDFYKNY